MQHWFGGGGGEGWRYTDTGEDRYVYYTKRGHFMEVSQHFCPLLWLKGNTLWLVFIGCDRFRTAPFFTCLLSLKRKDEKKEFPHLSF